MNRPKIITYYEPQPVPSTRFDWSALREGYEPGDPIGYGSCKAEAILDLKEQEEAEERAP